MAAKPEPEVESKFCIQLLRRSTQGTFMPSFKAIAQKLQDQIRFEHKIAQKFKQKWPPNRNRKSNQNSVYKFKGGTSKEHSCRVSKQSLKNCRTRYVLNIKSPKNSNKNGRQTGTGSRIKILYTSYKEVHPRNIRAEFERNRIKTEGGDTF